MTPHELLQIKQALSTDYYELQKTRSYITTGLDRFTTALKIVDSRLADLEYTKEGNDLNLPREEEKE